MKYLRIEQATSETLTHVVVVAEDPAAVLREAARVAEELLNPIPAASEPAASAEPRCAAAPFKTSSEMAFDFAVQTVRHLIEVVKAHVAPC